MRYFRKELAIMLPILLVILSSLLLPTDLLIPETHDNASTNEVSTSERYGKNIIYYDLSKIPGNLTLDRKIELPQDLEKFLYNYPLNEFEIENPLRFEQEVWEEASKIGYSPDGIKNMNVQEAIIASVEIVVSRFTYHEVDRDEDFIRKYGEFLPIDVYFHLKKGDCDKYKYATLAVFRIIKRLNPRLQNVYLSDGSLGGNLQPHAWIAIIIPQDDYLLLSHIDPQAYDDGYPLEAWSYHISLKYNFYIAYFYSAIGGYENYIYAYQILEEEFLNLKMKSRLIKAESKLFDPWWYQESILFEMGFLALSISHYEPQVALNKILWVIKQYETERSIPGRLSKIFYGRLDGLLYFAYKIHLRAGNELEAEKYKQRLLREFPNSGWIRWMD